MNRDMRFNKLCRSRRISLAFSSSSFHSEVVTALDEEVEGT